MPEDLYPRPIALANYLAYQASHAYSLGNVVKPTTPNGHIYYVTTAGPSSSEPSWPTTTQATVTSGSVTFTEHGSVGGVQYLKYLQHPRDWKAVTVVSEFEDGGADFLEHASAPRRWTLEYDGLTDTEAAILDTFWESHRLSIPFTFVEPRDHPWTPAEGTTYNGVCFESYDRDHLKVKGIQKRTETLIKRPV